MGGALYSAEVVLGVVVPLALLVVAVVLLRRRSLGRGAVLVLCMLTIAGGRPRGGLLRLTQADLEWYPVFGLTSKAAHRWSRRSVEFGPPVAATTEAGVVLGPAVRVDMTALAHVGGIGHAHLVMPARVYPAVRSWVEAASPGHRPLGG